MLPSLSSSACVRGTIATPKCRRRRSGDPAPARAVPFGASVSPVCVAGELRHRGDVAGDHLRQRRLLLAAQHEQAVQPLRRAGAAVEELIVGRDPCPTAP